MAKRAKTKRRKPRAFTAKKRRKTRAVAAKKRRKTRPVARKKKTDEHFVTDAEAERLRHAQPSKSYVLAEEGTKPLIPEDKDSSS